MFLIIFHSLRTTAFYIGRIIEAHIQWECIFHISWYNSLRCWIALWQIKNRLRLWEFWFVQKIGILWAKVLKLSQRLNDEVIRKCGPKFWKKGFGPNGPNRPNKHENLHLKHQSIGKRSADIILNKFWYKML